MSQTVKISSVNQIARQCILLDRNAARNQGGQERNE